MSNINEYKDIVAFHPGYYIADIIEDMEISQAEFATRMGTSTKTLSQLINGKSNISNDLAKKLSVMLGTSIEVWLNLQNTYDQKLIEIQKAKDIDSQAELAKEIVYKYLVDVNDKVNNLCKFFMVSNLRIMLQQDFLVNFRASVSCISEKNIINSRAWIQTAMNISKNIDTKPYNAAMLKEV